MTFCYYQNDGQNRLTEAVSRSVHWAESLHTIEAEKASEEIVIADDDYKCPTLQVTA